MIFAPNLLQIILGLLPGDFRQPAVGENDSIVGLFRPGTPEHFPIWYRTLPSFRLPIFPFLWFVGVLKFL